MRSLDPAAVARVRELLVANTPYREICAELGCTKATVSRYAARLGLGRPKRRLDWPTIRAYYEAGHSRHATLEHFGLYVRAWQEAVKRGDIVPRPPRAHVRPLSELTAAPAVQRGHLKRRLIVEGHLQPRCAWCGIDSWRGLALSLELDHINGNPQDNRLANLRLLCPNCHSQTETYSGRNAIAPRPPRPTLESESNLAGPVLPGAKLRQPERRAIGWRTSPVIPAVPIGQSHLPIQRGRDDLLQLQGIADRLCRAFDDHGRADLECSRSEP